MKKDTLINVGLLLVVILLGIFLYLNYGPTNHKVSSNEQKTPSTSDMNSDSSDVLTTPKENLPSEKTPLSTTPAESDNETYTNTDVPKLQEGIHLEDVKKSSDGAFNMYLFYGKGCPHCEELIKFLQSLSDQEKTKFHLYTFETWYDNENKELLEDVKIELNKNIGGVPFLVIGEKTFSGYGSSMNNDIMNAIDAEYTNTNRYDLGVTLLKNQ